MAFLLNAADIDRASAQITEYLQEQKLKSADILRIRLGAEDALVRLSERFGEIPFTLRTGKVFGKIKVSLSVAGDMFDPFTRDGDDGSTDSLMRAALVGAGAMPSWKYVKGTNSIVFTYEKKRVPDWAVLLSSVAAAVLLWLVMKLLPEGVNSFVYGKLFIPLADKFLGFLRAVAGPLIFLSIVWGICGMGDVAVFNVLGKRIGGRYLLYGLLLPIAANALSLPFFALSSGSSSGAGGFDSVFSLVLDIIPDNMITPFSSGNTLQILFMGIIIGLATIVISEKTQALTGLVEQLNSVIQVIMKFVGKLIPAFIFISIYNLLAGGGAAGLTFSGKFILINAVGCLLMNAVCAAIACVRMKLSPALLLRKDVRALLIALTTASSTAAFEENARTCREGYGIDNRIINFGIPLSQALFKPSVGLLYVSAVLCAAESCGIAITLPWIAVALLSGCILGIATPPVPGGVVACFTVLFTQMGLPTDVLPAVLTVSVILDFITTATNVFTGQCMMILSADSFGMIDKEKLRDPAAK